jgi:hypothetical protein
LSRITSVERSYIQTRPLLEHDGENPQQRNQCQEHGNHKKHLEVLKADGGLAFVVGWMCVT